jgi:hypothetical protein
MGSKKAYPSRRIVSLWQMEEDEEGSMYPDVRIVSAIIARWWQVELLSLRQ